MRSSSSLAILLSLLGSLLVSPLPALAAPSQGTLIKLSCPANADPGHACKAVYFHGHDGKRHAFSNDKAYFTWYADFSGVQTVSSAFLASIPLGANVTYRPGSKMVKFTSVNTVYAVALGGSLRWVKTEDAAKNLYGVDWNTHIDDINDAFFGDYRFGSDISAPADFNPADERAATPTIDANLPSTFRSEKIVTPRGSFDAEVVTLQKNHFDMITDTADTTDCTTGCAVKPLADYVAENGATIGIHGTYFCPPEYADCASKTNSFFSPVYNSATHVMLNAGSLPIHEGPMIASATDGRTFFFHRTKDFGSIATFEASNHATLGAALANYPSLIEGGAVIVESEARLAETQPTVKSIRGGIGFNDQFIYLVIVHGATVTDLAYVMQTLGSTSALNLDGGGSGALWYEGAYVYGPGRSLPNAILFKQK